MYHSIGLELTIMYSKPCYKDDILQMYANLSRISSNNHIDRNKTLM
jgi:hypothetical protein